MGNIQGSNEESEFQAMFSWCVGTGRREENEGGDKTDQTFRGKQRTTTTFEPLPGALEDVERSYSNPLSTSYGNMRTPRSVRKSTAELTEVGMSEGKTKQRYLTHANLDDAFAEG
jgi:hypothetical protein